ncbi:MAG TPA: histidine kinase [Solirubrobacter sp.]|nr:histidine kinase [Solirubrobacter sp.]
MATITSAPVTGPAARPLHVGLRSWTVTAAGLSIVATVSTTVLALTSRHVEHPLATALVTSYYTVAPALIGVLWLRRRPASRFGPLLILFGAAGWLFGLQSSDVPAVHSLAVMGDFVLVTLNIYVCLAFPSGRLEHWIDRALNAVFVFAMVQFAIPWLLLSPAVQGAGPLSRCVPSCPGNPFQVGSAPELLTALAHVEIVVGATATVGVLLRFLWRLGRGTPPQRRALTGVALSSGLLLPVFVTYHVIGEFAPGAREILVPLGWVLIGARLVFPLGFLAALIQADMFAAAVQRRLMEELAAGPTPRHWQASVARALDDPHVRLGYWDGYVYRDAGGARLPAPAPPQTWFPVARAARPVAVIAADVTLRDDPELVAAAASATLVAVERGDLMGELRASRARMVAAADAARSRLQRDLHDGAQQRLVALRVRLGLAAEHESGEQRTALETFGSELDGALQEVRELAHGLYPRTLSQAGVPEAVRGLPAASAAAVAVHDHGFGRHPPEVENAVYFACLEAVQNASKHAAGATRIAIELGREPGAAWFRVADDGPGFDPATAPPGAGLVNMADRLAAVGGTLAVQSAPGTGCRVSGSVPLAGSPSPGDAA